MGKGYSYKNETENGHSKHTKVVTHCKEMLQCCRVSEVVAAGGKQKKHFCRLATILNH